MTEFDITEGKKVIRSFTDLRVWQEAHQLVLEIYRITWAFPLVEQYGLGSQMRRAAVSITSNIAEGFTRITSKEKRQYYVIAQGSLTEIQSQLFIARDERYIDEKTFGMIFQHSTEVNKLINGLKRSIPDTKLNTKYQIPDTKY